MSKIKEKEAVMDKKTATALEGSIDKWKKIVGYLKYNRNIDFAKLDKLEQGSLNCPLCWLFPDCLDCPVVGKSGYSCNRTPYEDFDHALWNKIIPDIKKYAKAELEFLKSLRD